MKIKSGIFLAALASVCVFAGSVFIAGHIDDTAESISSENAAYSLVEPSAESIGDYVIGINEFDMVALAKTEGTLAKNVSCTNNYGTFTVDVKNGSITKYKYGDTDTSKKYLVKGTAKFSKKDVTFNGYFLVDTTLSGYKKNQMTMYKGTLDLPNGDKYDGTLSNGQYYDTGTYTWKDGSSYTGPFTKTNKLGMTTLGENVSSSYGTFYFDSGKKIYLQIRFVNGVPKKSGTYVTNSKKYTVTFDDNGNCIATSLNK